MPYKDTEAKGIYNRAYQKIYYLKNQEAMKARKKTYYEKNREAIKAQQRDYRHPGVYKWFNEQNEIVYIGKGSKSRANRPGKPEGTRVQWHRCKDHADAMVIEAMLIRRHRPPMNVTGVSR